MDGFPSTDPTAFKPSLIRPVWADPGYFLALYNTTLTDVKTSGGGIHQLAPARPDRWAIGFSISPLSINQIDIGPWANPDGFTAARLSATGWTWFTLFDFGPIVTFEWFANLGGADTVRVIDVFNR